jgi:SAM-dependent methyltransferase
MLELARLNARDAGREVSGRLRFHQADVRTAILAEQFDAVVSLFHVMSYQTSNDDLDSSVATARRHINVGAHFLFDFWYAPAVLKAAPSSRTREVEDCDHRVTRIANPTWHKELNQVEVAYRFSVLDKRTNKTTEFTETHRMRYFFQDELEGALIRGGFRLVKCREWLSAKAATDDSFSAYMIAVAV